MLSFAVESNGCSNAEEEPAGAIRADMSVDFLVFFVWFLFDMLLYLPLDVDL